MAKDSQLLLVKNIESQVKGHIETMRNLGFVFGPDILRFPEHNADIDSPRIPIPPSANRGFRWIKLSRDYTPTIENWVSYIKDTAQTTSVSLYSFDIILANLMDFIINNEAVEDELRLDILNDLLIKLNLATVDAINAVTAPYIDFLAIHNALPRNTILVKIGMALYRSAIETDVDNDTLYVRLEQMGMRVESSDMIQLFQDICMRSLVNEAGEEVLHYPQAITYPNLFRNYLDFEKDIAPLFDQCILQAEGEVRVCFIPHNLFAFIETLKALPEDVRDDLPHQDTLQHYFYYTDLLKEMELISQQEGFVDLALSIRSMFSMGNPLITSDVARASAAQSIVTSCYDYAELTSNFLQQLLLGATNKTRSAITAQVDNADHLLAQSREFLIQLERLFQDFTTQMVDIHIDDLADIVTDLNQYVEIVETKIKESPAYTQKRSSYRLIHNKLQEVLGILTPHSASGNSSADTTIVSINVNALVASCTPLITSHLYRSELTLNVIENIRQILKNCIASIQAQYYSNKVRILNQLHVEICQQMHTLFTLLEQCSLHKLEANKYFHEAYIDQWFCQKALIQRFNPLALRDIPRGESRLPHILNASFLGTFPHDVVLGNEYEILHQQENQFFLLSMLSISFECIFRQFSSLFPHNPLWSVLISFTEAVPAYIPTASFTNNSFQQTGYNNTGSRIFGSISTSSIVVLANVCTHYLLGAAFKDPADHGNSWLAECLSPIAYNKTYNATQTSITSVEHYSETACNALLSSPVVVFQLLQLALVSLYTMKKYPNTEFRALCARQRDSLDHHKALYQHDIAEFRELTRTVRYIYLAFSHPENRTTLNPDGTVTPFDFQGFSPEIIAIILDYVYPFLTRLPPDVKIRFLEACCTVPGNNLSETLHYIYYGPSSKANDAVITIPDNFSAESDSQPFVSIEDSENIDSGAGIGSASSTSSYETPSLEIRGWSTRHNAHTSHSSSDGNSWAMHVLRSQDRNKTPEPMDRYTDSYSSKSVSATFLLK